MDQLRPNGESNAKIIYVFGCVDSGGRSRENRGESTGPGVGDGWMTQAARKPQLTLAPRPERDDVEGNADLEAQIATVAAVVQVRIADLRVGDSPRLDGLDREHVRMLAESQQQMPPIYVHQGSMCVIDGMHRVAAARLNGQVEIGAEFFYGSVEEAFCVAVRANVAHGLPLTLVDREAAAERIIQANPALSDRSIATITALAPKTVASIRQRVGKAGSVSARLGRDGRVRPLSTAEGRRIAWRAIQEKPEASLRDIARIAGVSVGTVRDVRGRLLAGLDPVPEQQRSGQRNLRQATKLQPADVEPVDIHSLLESLRGDPSLRYADSGRAFLRWLASRIPSATGAIHAAYQIPPHSGILVARVAREYSRLWAEFADEMESLGRECG